MPQLPYQLLAAFWLLLSGQDGSAEHAGHPLRQQAHQLQCWQHLLA
jgi:hypothetical protein